MSKNTTTLAALATTVTALEGSVAALVASQARTQAAVDAFLAGQGVTAPTTEAAVETVVVTQAAPAAEGGPTFSELRAALKAHKLAGKIQAGVTVKDAIRDGLMNADGTLPGAPAGTAAPVGATSKAALKEALKAHKAAGHIPAGVSVKNALAQGLMSATGDLLGKAVIGEADKALAAKVEGQSRAKVTPVCANGPRNALGQTTKQDEWPLRTRLIAQGLSPKQVDKAVKKARKANALSA